MTNSTKKLIEQLSDSTKRLLITTIQKMNNAIKNPKSSEYMERYKNERVIFIIDECHRSQFGEMHKEIKKHFNQAQYFGFTGTPIFEDQAGKDMEM
jgi:type I restriction enzyme R subunit